MHGCDSIEEMHKRRWLGDGKLAEVHSCDCGGGGV